ncbi:MAG: hypothetical protein P8Y36_08325, partial [Alphaproteobacteria bacterium]
MPLYRIKYLLQWWEKKRASDIKPKACRDYIEWRLKQVGVRGVIQEGTARKDLETLRAALRFYHEEQPLMTLPVVKLPKKPGRREEWLSRNQAAALVWAAWRNPDAKHLARFALIRRLAKCVPTSLNHIPKPDRTHGGQFRASL